MAATTFSQTLISLKDPIYRIKHHKKTQKNSRTHEHSSKLITNPNQTPQIRTKQHPNSHTTHKQHPKSNHTHTSNTDSEPYPYIYPRIRTKTNQEKGSTHESEPVFDLKFSVRLLISISEQGSTTSLGSYVFIRTVIFVLRSHFC